MEMPNEGEQQSEYSSKSRRTHRKVRTGCLTCKIRRVKCDEGRPICLRCVRVGLACDGYPDFAKQKKKPSRPLLAQAPLPERTSPASHTLLRSPKQSLFKNDNESAAQLSGYFESDFWHRRILQACETNSSIRHAVIAIGALDLATWKVPAKSPEERLRRQFAYHEYSIAIREMRNKISEGKFDLRTKLIAISLFICFEIYHGNSDAAVSQIQTGSVMIEEQCRKWNKDNVTSKPPSSIDNQLLENFTELEIQAVAHSGYKMNVQQKHRLVCRQNILECMPNTFSTLDQARATLHLLTIRQVHRTVELGGTGPHRGCTIPAHPVVTGSDLSKSAREELNKRFTEYKNWEAASKHLFIQARNSRDDRLVKCAIITRLTYLTSYLSMYSRMLGFRENYYNQTHLLAEIITLVQKLSASEKADSNLGFSMNMNLIVPLSFVAWRYRHRALRQEAIKLLLASPRREGLWDGVFIARASQWMAEIEEEGLGSEEYVPHELARTVEATDVDVFARTATLKALLNRKTSPGKQMVIKESKIKW
ncbi:hypothetical protein N431DRAFT_504193 [Stipitochalara longipes BDJ]|nr:hypothetical protein N431DRAFT_504193 [Stipitochalara longipes BDJ]